MLCKNKCSALLTALLITIKDVIVCQMKDHLSDGKLWNPSPQLMKQAKSCMPHNLGGECRFGFADSYMTQAPNATLEKVESRVMFKTNKTHDWLISQPENKWKEHIEIARKMG